MEVHDFREKFYETINGEKILFASANVGENLITANLLMLLGKHIKENRSGFFLLIS